MKQRPWRAVVGSAGCGGVMSNAAAISRRGRGGVCSAVPGAALGDGGVGQRGMRAASSDCGISFVTSGGDESATVSGAVGLPGGCCS